MEILKLPVLGQPALLSVGTVHSRACPASRLSASNLYAEVANTRGKSWLVFSSSNKLPEAQGADVWQPSEPAKPLSPDLLNALRLALPKFIWDTTVTRSTLSDTLRKGRLMKNNKVFRQAFVVRSSEVGPDKVASIETLANLFQEVALNHVMHSGIGTDGFGTTKAMFSCGLIWVVRRMHVEVDHFPSWGSVVELDSWVASHSRAANGMRRDWVARDFDTQQVIARGTSQWVLMDIQTRKMARMPREVKDEISPFLNDVFAIPTETLQKIIALDEESAEFVQRGLMPHRNDLDLNLHVNNVKYIPWLLESVPEHVLQTSQLRSITMDYRRECNQHDVVVSLTSSERSVLTRKRKGVPSSPPGAGMNTCWWHTLRKEDGSAIVTAMTVWRMKTGRSHGHSKKPESADNTRNNEEHEQ